MQYSDFFEKATGRSPFPYQDAVAQRVELPSIIQAPTGSGKMAAVILGWLWRRFHADDEIRKSSQRRLVYCLPMRVLVDQTFRIKRRTDIDWPCGIEYDAA